MAVNIINEPQLREQLGGLTKYRHGVDYIDSPTLQRIIDFHTDALTDFVYRKARTEPLPDEIFSAQTFDLIDSTEIDGAKEATLPITKFPIAVRAVADGIPLEIVDAAHLALQSVTSNWDSYSIAVTRDKIFVIPNSLENVNVWLANEDELAQRIASNEILNSRQNILNEAKAAIDNRREAAGVILATEDQRE